MGTKHREAGPGIGVEVSAGQRLHLLQISPHFNGSQFHTVAEAGPKFDYRDPSHFRSV